MSSELEFSLSITPTWSIIKKVQEQAISYMSKKGHSKDLTDATMMAATELIENAIKYGVEKPSGENIDFDLRADDEKVKIEISNGIKDDADIENVTIHIDKLKKSDNYADLYIERLQELMENPKPGVSQLGLYRIAYEGEFALDYKYENKVLSIIAERKF